MIEPIRKLSHDIAELISVLGIILDRRKIELVESLVTFNTEVEVVRLPSFGGHPISADFVSVGEDVHCES
ncbi:hypothetical protein, partial [Corynebacterium accolens]|uniref:hypothetical protein n=1 Tax=Corynebacterium accolens TaxID=38284 RepID=UPI0025435A8C